MTYPKYEPKFTSLDELIAEKKQMREKIKMKQESFEDNVKDAGIILTDTIKAGIVNSPKKLFLSWVHKIFKYKS